MSERDDELVYLTLESGEGGGEFMRRSALPNDALRAAWEIDGTDLDGGSPRMYTVYTVAR